MKRTIRHIKAKLFDFLLLPITVISALWFRRIRRLGIRNMPLTAKVLQIVKIYPLKEHFYEPLVDRSKLDRQYSKSRQLHSIDWNAEEQLKILDSFSYQNELKEMPIDYSRGGKFSYKNGYFGPGDAEYYYSVIREYKPKKIIEIGSGYSTLIGCKAIEKNIDQDKNYSCDYVCIEPYKRDWLATLQIKLERKCIEKVNIDLIETLNKNDILFIDSSHMIRPQGDVLHEYLELLPRLKSGVFVHIHDIFSPNDYPNKWIIDGERERFWNEQYLVEAFMSFNAEFRIIGALRYMQLNYLEKLCQKLPMVDILKPEFLSSFWIVRN